MGDANGCNTRPLAAPYHIDTCGWAYDPKLTADENYSDLALIASRSSTCDGGHMGTVLVSSGGDVLCMAVNSTLFDLNGNKSDVHAEANCLCACARRGVATEGCTIYITMPPCKPCFGLLQAAGVRRIVHRRINRLEDMNAAAQRLGIEMVGTAGHAAEDASLDRAKALWAHFPKPKRQKLNPAPTANDASQTTSGAAAAEDGAGPSTAPVQPAASSGMVGAVKASGPAAAAAQGPAGQAATPTASVAEEAAPASAVAIATTNATLGNAPQSASGSNGEHS